jgi:predicted outer membrane repeat protein
LIALLLLNSTPASLAATLTVGPSATYTTVQSAVDAASSGDTISIKAGTYDENIETGGKKLTIKGASTSTVKLSPANGAAMTIESGETITISNLTFKGGQQGLIVRGSTATLSGVDFLENGGWTSGAGMLVADGSTVAVSECEVTDNAATSNFNGGGFYVSESTLTVSDCVFSGNSGRHGGALYIEDSDVTISAATFTDNTSAVHGGAVDIAGGSSVVVSDSTLSANVSTQRGGVFQVTDSDLSLTDCTVSGNEAGTSGGVMYVDGLATDGIVLSGVVMDSNVAAGSGGAIYALSTAVTWSGTASANAASTTAGAGGVVYGSGTALSFSDLVFTSNQAENGGAIYATSDCSLALDAVDMTENTASGSGGAIWSAAAVAYEEGELLGNRAYADGGALYVEYNSLDLDDLIFTSNDASNGGGGIYSTDGSADLEDCDFTTNSATNGGGIAALGGSATIKVKLQRVEMTGNTAVQRGGGLYIDTASSSYVYNGRFDSNSAGSWGGGMYGASIGTLQVTKTTFQSNEGSYGGGLYAYSIKTGYTRHVDFRGNTATQLGGGAVYSDPRGSHTIGNSRFVENTADEGAGIWIQGDDAGYHPLSQLDLVGNNGDGISLEQSSGASLTNSIVYDNVGAGVRADKESAAGTFTYIDCYGNDQDWRDSINDLTGVDGNISVDPRYSRYARDGDASLDFLYLSVDSPLRDAGDPKTLDPDGSRADMGSYGGENASWSDEDEDGYDPSAGDCDEGNAEINPGAADVWYDGIDQDCAGDDDYDQDADGWRSAIDSTDGDDCNDVDASIYPGAKDPLGDKIDQDCDGVDGIAPTDTGGTDTGGTDSDGGSSTSDGGAEDGGSEDPVDVDQDGWSVEEGDCNDNSADAYPFNNESCRDDLDNDCDDFVDDFDADCNVYSGGCACSSGALGSSGLSAWWALGLGLAALRRGRGRRTTR